MLPKLFRVKDAEKLALLHPDLSAIVYRCAGLGYKFIVIETTRGKAKQTAAHNSGHSNATFGKSAHNYDPAFAVDLGPRNYPGKLADYKELALGIHLAARELNIGITWGGDWSIRDYPHFELSNWKSLALHSKLAK